MNILSISAILKNKGIGLKSCFEQLFIHSSLYVLRLPWTDSWINCTTESQSDCKDYHWFPNECSIIEYLIYTSIWCDCCLRDMSFCLEVLKLVVSSVLIVEEEWFDWKSYLLDGEEEEILGLPVQYDQVLTLIYQFCLLFLEEFPWSKQTWYS